MRVIDHLPILTVVSSLIGAYLSPIVAAARRRWLRWFVPGVTALVLMQAIGLLVQVGRAGPVSYQVGGWPPPFGVELAVGPAAALLAVVIAGVAALVALFAGENLEHEVAPAGHGWYNAAFLLALAGMLGLVVANDLFNIFVMTEITTLGAVGLVVARGSWGAAEAGLRYLLLASLGATLSLFGLGLGYMITGHLNLAYFTAALPAASSEYPLLAATSLGLLGLGFALKAAAFPLHVWLPEAHANAPGAASALLSGLVVKVYAFTLIRLVFVVFAPLLAGGPPVRAALAWAGAAAILGGSIFALVQVDLKRILAYSTVAQLGYVFLGAGLANPAGLIAAFYQIVSHALTKACLFLCAAIIIERTGRRQITELGGLGQALPLTAAAFTVCALSMIGLPLLSGFVVKWYLVQAGLAAGLPALALLVVASGLLNAAYYLPIVWRFYFGPARLRPPARRTAPDPAAWPQPGPWRRLLARLEAPWQLLLPVLAMAAGGIVLGVWTGPLLGYLGGVAGGLLNGVGP